MTIDRTDIAPQSADTTDQPVAIIIGGASGIGAAAAELFAQRQWKTVLADLNAAEGERVAAGIGNSAFVRTDVAVEEQVEALIAHAVERFGRVDCLVHSAGLVGASGSIVEMTAEAWSKTNAILLNSVFYAIKHVARAMIPARKGSIVVISSIAGVTGGIGAHAYTTAKHGAIGLVKSAAAELAYHGITVNSVAPGSTVTPLIEPLHGGHDGAVERSALASLLRRPIFPVDIANSVLFLATEAGANISGQVLVVDGGLTAAGLGRGGGVQFHRQPAAFIAPTASPDY